MATVLQVHAFYRETTGADRYCRDLGRLLEAHGHRVAFFCARNEGDDASEWSRYFPEGSMTGAEARPGPLRAVRDAAKFVFHLEARRRAAEIADDVRPDVVHAHNLFHHLSPSVLAPLRRRAPVVMTLHDYKLVCPNYVLHTRGAPCTACRGGRFDQAVRNRCVRDSALKSALCAVEGAVHWALGLYRDGVDRFVAPSAFLRDRFVEFGFPEERITVVRNFTPLPAEPPAPEGDFVLFAGRMIAVKGVRTLLEAWRATRSRKHVRLVLAGDGPLVPEIAREIREHGLAEVEGPAPLDKRALAAAMSRALAVVVPSEWYEPCPLVVLEAQARGRCVVASRIGGIPELVADGETGLLVEPGGAADLAAAIDAAVEDGALRRRLGAAARERCLRESSPEVHHERVRAVYEGVLGRRIEERAVGAAAAGSA